MVHRYQERQTADLVGGTPSLVAAVLLAEYVLVAIVAAAAGLAVGSLTAPLLTESGAGLIGSAGPPSRTMSTVGLVTAVALGVAAVATGVPAVRVARSSTVSALAGSARPPRRTGWLIAISARLLRQVLLVVMVIRSGSCSPWWRRPESWWRRSPLFPPGSAAAVP